MLSDGQLQEAEAKEMSVRVKTKGNFNGIEKFLKAVKGFDPMPVLKQYGEIGVVQLMAHTPIDSGLTAASWYYEIEKQKDGYILRWNNRNVVSGLNIAILIQYGHGTPSGAYVQGLDYINPALRDVFDNIATNVWREVSD